MGSPWATLLLSSRTMFFPPPPIFFFFPCNIFFKTGVTLPWCPYSFQILAVNMENTGRPSVEAEGAFCMCKASGGFAPSFQGGFCWACMGSVKWERIRRKCFLSVILEGFSGPFSAIKILWMCRTRGTWPRIVTWLLKPELNDAGSLLLMRFLGTHFVPCSIPHPRC